MKKLAVFDIDGTLITKKDKLFPETAINALRQLKNKGMCLAIATGRPISSIAKNVANKAEFDYFICENGAYIADSKLNNLFYKGIPNETIDSIVEELKQNDESLNLRYPNNGYCACGYEKAIKFARFFLGEDFKLSKDTYKDRPKDVLPTSGVSFILEENIEYYRKKYDNLVFVKTSMENYYDITLKGVNKGEGLLKLCEIIGIEPDEVVAFGDDYNDIELIKYAGTGIAMGDAVSELKELADYVTETCINDGIDIACRFFSLI